jgi:hypothetical protein
MLTMFTILTIIVYMLYSAAASVLQAFPGMLLAVQ